ncbi:hypothetical protein HXZ62_14985 [Empedobacter falsenii]|uniref:hypothetical protein n=1 Tax=Empedobacter falsenii TaxID=343874 RepID=UPI0025791ED9|nr:hypothetical protein [Empedobacter falsenii]MDM1063851.1 hypothetical protein [Empedobacter falsenii]
MKKQLKNILCGSLFLLLPFTNLHAEDGGSGVDFFSEKTANTNPGGHDPGDDPVDGAPINSYTIVLLFTAVVIGYYGRNKFIRNH